MSVEILSPRQMRAERNRKGNNVQATDSAILERLAPLYDDIVASVYRAGSGLEPWLKPITEIATIFDAWTVQLFGANKITGTMSFSFEAGSAPAAAPIEYLRYYHRVDPRLSKVLASLLGEWFSCEDHFDDDFVETDPFYRDYLIPFGARYLFGGKLIDDDSMTVLIGHVSRVGNAPLRSAEKEAFVRLSAHFTKALQIQKRLSAVAGQQSVGQELLDRLRQPILLIDNQRRITYRNQATRKLIGDDHLIYVLDGRLACINAESDLDLTLAVRALALAPITTHGVPQGPVDRQSLRLVAKDGRTVAATLLALRPESTMASFGRAPQALFTVFEPGVALDIDPFMLSATFDLTPAEARLAAKIVNGETPEQCARTLGVKISTVRSQLMAIYGKTGATGQADLVRLVLSATAI